jgi:hypothetical protein
VIRSRRRLAVMLAATTFLVACQSGADAPSPLASGPDATQLPELLTARFEVGPPPGPIKPFRGEVISEVQVYRGYVSMRLVLRNTGEEPVTFLNTLYDYEPLQLYEPLVRLEWTDGTAASNTRRGRFFPTPAILEPGEEAVYLMGGQQVLDVGDGEIGDLVTHIKYCPTRGMEDQPGLPLEVTDLEWETGPDGITTVRGTIHETQDVRRFGSPTVGVEFIGPGGEFLGAIVDDGVGSRMEPGESRPFEISGPGVRTEGVVSVGAAAWVR